MVLENSNIATCLRICFGNETNYPSAHCFVLSFSFAQLGIDAYNYLHAIARAQRLTHAHSCSLTHIVFTFKYILLLNFKCRCE